MTDVRPVCTWISLLGGALALGHRPKKTSFARLREEGCTAILTLLDEREGARVIGDGAARAGIEWIWLPLESGTPPSSERDHEMRPAFERVKALVVGGGRVFVHCSADIHRTGMIAYALLRHLGLAEDEARRVLRELRAVTAEGVGDARLAWGDRFGQQAGGNDM